VSSTSTRDPLRIATLFLDAGGVLCHPSWTRVSAALAAHGIVVSREALAAAEPYAKREIDTDSVVKATDDHKRGWLYFNRVLELAGVSVCDATDAAIADIRAYHGQHNVWEDVPADVPPTLAALRGLGVKLVVVSNANGRLGALFDRVGLTRYFDVILDSHDWGLEKPDPRLFAIALQQSNSDPLSTAHVGDIFHIDVAGARAAGLAEGILLDTAGLYPDVDCRRLRTLDELLPAIVVAR
jgi:HAD superfamily hydrolase (TIGR01549 family)